MTTLAAARAESGRFGMFHAPEFWRALRRDVAPFLRTYPVVRIWTLGAAGGEDAWSLAIWLEEEELLERSRVYTTDPEDSWLRQAEAARFSAARQQEFARNHKLAGGKRPLSDYLSTAGGRAQLDRRLFHRSLFAAHAPSTDGVFNSFHLALVRTARLAGGETRTLELAHESLIRLGTLALEKPGTFEGLALRAAYRPVDESQGIYRRFA